MGEVFKSTHAKTQQMLSVYGTLKEFFDTSPETRRTLSEPDKQSLSAYKEIGSFADSIGIPPYVSHYAKNVYGRVHGFDGFEDHDQKLVIASCLCVACSQLKIPRAAPEIFALVPSATEADMKRWFESLELFFVAEIRQKTTETPQEIVTDTSADAHSAERIVHKLQELSEQLTLIENLDRINRPDTIVRASFTPTVPAPASFGPNEGEG